MKHIQTLDVEGPNGRSEIVLFWGNLMDVGKDEPIDMLVVSTFPNDYTPTPTSVVGALSFRGVDLGELAQDKAIDLGSEFGSWMSQDIGSLRSGVMARRILCIEGSSPQRLFRSLVATLSDERAPVTVAMPVIGTGDQGDPFEDVFPSILEAAVEWILLGLPLRRLEIVIPNKKKAGEAGALFEKFVRERVVSAVRLRKPGPGEHDFDIFLSYSHKDSRPADTLLGALQAQRLRVFMDRKDVAPGTIWQHEILKELDHCSRVVALLSASYLDSAMCIEEFNIAMIRQRTEQRALLIPIYWRSAKFPTYMQQHQWIDCREGDEAKIRDAAAHLTDLCRGAS